jgi:ribosome maturation factor RimP
MAAVEEIGRPVAEARGLRLVDVELVREAGRTILRFVLDKPGGVTLEDLEGFHRAVDPALDAADPIPHAYYVEVSSPGLDRPLRKDRDFQVFAGRQVEVATFGPLEGRRVFIGRLEGLEGDAVVLTDGDGHTWRIPRAQVARARLHAEF